MLLYFLLSLVAFTCLIEHAVVLLWWWRHHESDLTLRPPQSPVLKSCVHMLVVLFSTIRWLYFLLILTGSMSEASAVGNALMAELPTYFYISMFTLLLLVWANATVAFKLRKDRAGRSVVRMALTALAVVVNVILYACLIAFIISESRFLF